MVPNSYIVFRDRGSYWINAKNFIEYTLESKYPREYKMGEINCLVVRWTYREDIIDRLGEDFYKRLEQELRVEKDGIRYALV